MASWGSNGDMGDEGFFFLSSLELPLPLLVLFCFEWKVREMNERIMGMVSWPQFKRCPWGIFVY